MSHLLLAANALHRSDREALKLVELSRNKALPWSGQSNFQRDIEVSRAG